MDEMDNGVNRPTPFTDWVAFLLTLAAAVLFGGFGYLAWPELPHPFALEGTLMSVGGWLSCAAACYAAWRIA